MKKTSILKLICKNIIIRQEKYVDDQNNKKKMVS